MHIKTFFKYKVDGNLAEWLRRRITNPLGYSRASSNLAVVAHPYFI